MASIPPVTARRVRPINILAYGTADIMGAGATGVIAAWLLFFYTTFCGLSAAQAATIFAVARVVDAVVSPLVGYVSDHFHRTAIGKRFGRRRIFLLIAIPLLPSFALMWVEGQSFWYYLATYILFDVVYAAVLIPYETLAPGMTRDFTAKSRLAGSRLLFGQVASVLAGLLPSIIIGQLGKESATTFLIQGAIFSGLFMIAVGITWAGTWEDRSDEALDTGPMRANPLVALFSDLGTTFRVRAFRQHLGMYLAGYISLDIFNAVFPYFVAFVLMGTIAGTAQLVAIQAGGQFVGVLLAMVIILRLQPARTYRLAILVWALALAGLFALYVIQPSSLWLWLGLCAAVAGVARGALAYIPWNLYNFMGDIDQLTSGRRRDGALAGVMTFMRKAAQAAAVMLIGLVLEWNGFIAAAKVQSDQTQTAILTLQFGAIALLLTIGWLIAGRFRLDRATYATVLALIERQRTGTIAPLSDDEAATVTALAGKRAAVELTR